MVSECYVLASAVAVATGMNLPLAHAISQADLARFKLHKIGDLSYTTAPVEYVANDSFLQKITSLISIVLDSLLSKLPRTLKPLPLLMSFPSSIPQAAILHWLEGSEFSSSFSKVTILNSSGIFLFQQSLQALKNHDSIVCISADSLLEQVESLAEEYGVVGSQSPWGIIPGEGAFGMILTKKSVLRSLKLEYELKIGRAEFDWDAEDRRGCLRLTRKIGVTSINVDALHSDMTNTRSHTEDLGFALGALKKQPTHLSSTNEWWGTIGYASSLATLASFRCLPDRINNGLVYLFDQNHSRALVQIEKS